MIALLLVAAQPPVEARILPAQGQPAPTAEVWQVDQVRLALDTPEATLKALAPDHTLAAVIKRLTGMGVPFARARAAMLPDRLPPKLRNQIEGLPPGEPFVLPERGFIGINVIVGRRLPSNLVLTLPSTGATSERG